MCSVSPPRSFDGSSPNLVGVCRWTSHLPLRGSFSKRSTGQRVTFAFHYIIYASRHPAAKSTRRMMTRGSRHTAAKSTQRLLLARRVNFLVYQNSIINNNFTFFYFTYSSSAETCSRKREVRYFHNKVSTCVCLSLIAQCLLMIFFSETHPP